MMEADRMVLISQEDKEVAEVTLIDQVQDSADLNEDLITRIRTKIPMGNSKDNSSNLEMANRTTCVAWEE